MVYRGGLPKEASQYYLIYICIDYLGIVIENPVRQRQGGILGRSPVGKLIYIHLGMTWRVIPDVLNIYGNTWG